MRLLGAYGDTSKFIPLLARRAKSLYALSAMTLHPEITSRSIAVGRANLAVEVLGRGMPVVFLHAAVCDSRMWQAQLEAAAARCKVIAYDRRGFGRTLADKQDHSAVADLVAVLAALADGAPAVLVACSQGGRIALDAALLHPGLVRGLILISPSVAGAPEPALPPEIAALQARQKQAEQAGDWDRANAMKARLWLDGPLQPEGRVGGPARQLFLEMNGIALQAPSAGANIDNVAAFSRLAEIRVPTLVMAGSFDFPHIQQRSRQLAETMPHASFLALPGTAHLPSLEQPALVTGPLMDFLARFPP